MVDWAKTYYNLGKELEGIASENVPKSPLDLLVKVAFANPIIGIPASSFSAVKDVVSDPRGQLNDTIDWYSQYRNPSQQIEDHPLGVLQDIGNAAAILGAGRGITRSMPKGTLRNMVRGIGDEGGYININEKLPVSYQEIPKNFNPMTGGTNKHVVRHQGNLDLGPYKNYYDSVAKEAFRVKMEQRARVEKTMPETTYEEHQAKLAALTKISAMAQEKLDAALKLIRNNMTKDARYGK
jgi:hypothetical protein